MAVSADSGSAAWGLLIIDSDQCLGHSDGTVVKADKSHFTLLINLLLLKLSRFPVIFKMSTRWRQTFFPAMSSYYDHIWFSPGSGTSLKHLHE